MMVNGQWTADTGQSTQPSMANMANANTTAPPSSPSYRYNPALPPNFLYNPSQTLKNQFNSVNSRFNAPLPAGWQGFNQPRQISQFTGLNNQISNANNLFNQQLPSSQPRTAAPLIGLLGQ